ncbi:MAG: hypothetical protein R3176_12475, partial [Woeseiaceae bacterium]|nr:hypothetical protein [Woeseiaceae bacterium]
MDDVAVILDLAPAGREYEVKLTQRTLQLPLAKRIHSQRRERHRPLSRVRLRHANGKPRVGPLPDVQPCPAKLNVLPTQPAKLRGAEPGENRGDEQGAPAALRVLDDGPDFVAGRNVHTNL